MSSSVYHTRHRMPFRCFLPFHFISFAFSQLPQCVAQTSSGNVVLLDPVTFATIAQTERMCGADCSA